MSMFNDISCGTKYNETECLANAKLVSLYARRFGKGQRSFIGPGSEKKRYCVSEDSPQGVWDNIAEKMLLEFADSGCPIFRATTPLSRGKLKSKGHGKTVDSLCCRWTNNWDYFSHTCLCKPAQSLRSSRRDMWRVWIPSRRERRDPLWWDNQDPHSCSVWSRQKFFWTVMTPAYQNFSVATIWRTNWKAVTTRQIE